MDIFFQDPDDPPVPPGEVRIRNFTAVPYPDGRRVRIALEVTPFQKRPSGEITIANPDGMVLATANIIETMTRKMELTLHLRGPAGPGVYRATADIFYQDTPAEDQNGGADEITLPERSRVDLAHTDFTLGEDGG